MKKRKINIVLKRTLFQLLTSASWVG